MGGWNKGLTKETDKRVAAHAKKLRGKSTWNKGLKCPRPDAKGKLNRGPILLEERIRASYIRRSNAEVFVTDTKAHANTIKARMLLLGVPRLCVKCGLGPEWQGEPLTLQLDHINGDGRDGRLENLRFLCPNCHTQTLTYAGRKTKSRRKGLLESVGKSL